MKKQNLSVSDLVKRGANAPILEFAIVLNAGTVKEGTPFYEFSIFAPYILFLDFFTKLGSTILI
jgi:hypothetical protein